MYNNAIDLAKYIEIYGITIAISNTSPMKRLTKVKKKVTKIPIKDKIKRRNPIMIYHIVIFNHPIFPILLDISRNLKAALSLLSLFAILARTMANIGINMISHKRAIENQVPAPAKKTLSPVPPMKNPVTAPENILVAVDRFEAEYRTAKTIIKKAGIE